MNKKIFLIISFIFVLFIGQFYNKAEALSIELIETKEIIKERPALITYQENQEYKLKSEIITRDSYRLILYQNGDTLWVKEINPSFIYLTQAGKVFLQKIYPFPGEKTLKIIDKTGKIVKKIDRGLSSGIIKPIKNNLLMTYEKKEQKGLIMVDTDGNEKWNLSIGTIGKIWTDPDSNYLFVKKFNKEESETIYQYTLMGELIREYNIGHYQAAVKDFYDSLVIFDAGIGAIEIYNYITGEKLLAYQVNKDEFPGSYSVGLNYPRFIGNYIVMTLAKGQLEIPGDLSTYMYEVYIRIIDLAGEELIFGTSSPVKGIIIENIKNNTFEIRGEQKIYVYKINE